MKSKQPKKIRIQPPLTIKLKFDNVNEKQGPNTRFTRDIADIKKMETCLQNVIKAGAGFTSDDALLSLDLMAKFKKMLETQLVGTNKFKFRIAKSARKVSNQRKTSGQSTCQQNQEWQEQRQINLSTNSDNENKLFPNSSVFQPRLTDTTEPKTLEKCKATSTMLTRTAPVSRLQIIRTGLKENNHNSKIKLEGLCGKENDTIFNNQARLKEEITRLMGVIQQKCASIVSMEQKMRQLKEKLEQHQAPKGANNNEGKQDRKASSGGSQSQKLIRIPSPNHLIDRLGCGEHEREIRRHLQLIIVSQNKEIQSLYQKLAVNQELFSNLPKKVLLHI